MRGYTIFIIAIVIALFRAPEASGQELRPPEARQGYYLSGGIRSGLSVGDAIEVGDLGSLNHFGLQFRVGQKALPWLGFGLTVGTSFDGNDDWVLSYGHLLLEIQLEPFPIDLAVRGSVGVGGGSISRMDESEEREDDPSFMFGSMYALGLSYDWFPFRKRSSLSSGGGALTFFVEGRYFPGGDVNLGGGFIGIEFTWWTGLDKRKLDLPPDAAFK